jgi:hypothetical protein
MMGEGMDEPDDSGKGTEEQERRFALIINSEVKPCWLCKGEGGWVVLRRPRGDDTPDIYGPDFVGCPVCGGTCQTDTLEYQRGEGDG